MSYDYKAKGAADFKAAKKDERLFHNPENHGRLYREGWHAARRAAAEEERLAGFEHAGQTPPKNSFRCSDCAPEFSCWSTGETCRKKPTGGTFVVTAGGKTSDPIPFNAKPDVVAAALETLRKPDSAPVPEKPLAGQLDLFG